MEKCDFTPVYDKSGKMIAKTVVGASGATYHVGKKMGSGGAGQVFEATKEGDKAGRYVYKEPKKIKGREQIISTIRSNIKTLIANPITVADSKSKTGQSYLPHFVRPLDMIPLKSGGFGYIMERVDTSEFVDVKTIIRHPDSYPDAKVICKFCKDFVKMFQVIHLKGWCYKDINEGNIFINKKTGDFWVIDCDNISVPDDISVIGSAGFMAPEIYKTSKPNTESDYFSIAVFLFRLLVGYFPMEGPATQKYMFDTDKDISSAAPYIFGSNAVFAFNPTDTSNAVYKTAQNAKNPIYKQFEKMYTDETNRWNSLPKSVKECFIRTFVTALPYEKRTQRSTTQDWYDCFDELEAHLVKCTSPKCNEHNYHHRAKCYRCGRKLPKSKPTPPPTQKPKEPQAVFNLKTLVGGKVNLHVLNLPVGKAVFGNQLHPDFPPIPYLTVRFSTKRGVHTVSNTSGKEWVLCHNGNRYTQASGMDALFKEHTVIKIDPSKCLLEVVGIQ